MIGYSLSFCIRDIIENKVNILDVDMIVAATAARDNFDWETLIDEYCRSYWRKNAPRARKAVAMLRAAGRIHQPRLCDQQHPGSDPIWRDA